jgi:3-oxoacyl-[acyl-carrier protein] reductase
MKLTGKVAVITGAGSGMGREVALEYAGQGARLVISSNVPEQNDAVVAECTDAGAEAIAVTTDVRNEDQVKELFRRCVEEFGRLDALVSAAGVDVQRSPEERLAENMRLEDWRFVQDVNLTGVFLCAREAIPHMKVAGGGSIMHFSVGLVRFPMPEWSAYITSKWAVEGFTKVLAQEVEPYNIRANCMQPGGGVVTGITPEWVTEEDRARFHEPRVIRDLAVYLASDESSFVTGRSLVASEWNKERNLVLCSCTMCTTRNPKTPIEWRGVTAL